jgi:hypothetical protein
MPNVSELRLEVERRCESRVQKVHPAQRTSNKQLKQQKYTKEGMKAAKKAKAKPKKKAKK